MLIECQECKHRISDKADRCPRCGADKNTYLGSGVYCSECRHPGHRAYDTCSNCGAPSTFLVADRGITSALHDIPISSEESMPPTFSNAGVPVENLVPGTIDRGRTLPGLWARFCAKQIDFALLIIPAAIVSFFLFRLTLPGLFDWNNEYTGSDMLFGLVTLFFVACFEGLLVSIFGSSPGKSLAGISLRTAASTKLTIGKSLARSLQAFAQGQGCGIPIIGFFTHLAAYDAVKKQGVAGWDKTSGVDYRSKPIGVLRWMLLVALAITSFGIAVSLTLLAGQSG